MQANAHLGIILCGDEALKHAELHRSAIPFKELVDFGPAPVVFDIVGHKNELHDSAVQNRSVPESCTNQFKCIFAKIVIKQNFWLDCTIAYNKGFGSRELQHLQKLVLNNKSRIEEV